MKQIFEHVDNALKDPIQAGQKLLTYLRDTESQLKGTDLSQNQLLEYTLKRFIRAATATNPTIRESATWLFRRLFEQQHKHIDTSKVGAFLADTTDSKNAQKNNEVSHLMAGRLMIIQTLAPYLDGFQKWTWKLLQSSINQLLGEQTLQTLYEVLKLHPNKKVLSELESHSVGHNRRVQLLRSLICARLKHQLVDHPSELFDEVAQLVVPEYPRENYIIEHLVQSTDWQTHKWKQYWESLLANYSDETKHGFKGIYFIMQLLKHLTNRQLTKDSIDFILHKELLDLWMNQLVVLNKNCRNLAASIEINTGHDEQLAFKVLEYFHEQKVIIGNVQKKHPLQTLYRTVNPSKYLKYLLSRLDSDYNEDELCEAYAFIRLTEKQVPVKFVTKVMRKLLQQKKQNELIAEKYYGMFWSLLTWRLKHISQIPNNKQIKQDPITSAEVLLDIYNKLKEEHVGQVDKVAEYITKLLEQVRIQALDRLIAFVHFCSAATLWTAITGEEVETCQELLMLGPDFQLYCNSVDSTEAPRKKRKTEDPKKPIHVLVEMFIAFLTRSPNFLRDTIESSFKTIINDLDKSDLCTLITVLTRPDNEYIEQNEAQQGQ